MENATILGISLGTRRCGLALIQNGTLVDWKVKSYDGRLSENKLIRIVLSFEKLIQRHGVKRIGVKVPGHIKTLAIDYLVRALNKICTKKDISLCIISIEDLKSNESLDVSNKESYMEFLSTRFPELTPLLKRHKKLKTEYYFKVFEAVGTAHYCQNQTIKGNTR